MLDVKFQADQSTVTAVSTDLEEDVDLDNLCELEAHNRRCMYSDHDDA